MSNLRKVRKSHKEIGERNRNGGVIDGYDWGVCKCSN